MLYRRTVMKLAFGLAIGLGVAVSAAAALEDKEDGNSAQVKVTWTDPAQFDELRFGHQFHQAKPEVWLKEFRKTLVKSGDRILPKDQHLSVTITDVKLAGDFEPWHGPDFHDVRVVKSIYPPRVKLSFTLTDANGNVIESGDRELRDLAFLNRGTSVRSNQPYRYEKRMLSDWLKREFAAEKR
ncbi:MAG: DUF3016 domain-containing protein [Dokdonella sp.]|uniref:DUF3016 domain-containing protein n=1 Tax=Dokdonella sp. TaxID=2291710 RepID=UPI001B462ACD|nr:DUF3016 domain-containing protein [Dokdonella sp.]MBK8123183.1 DUF3016 domain-containing protein [Dokdonella sp.]MBP6329448.1 DUF3016 domain-containing protein [Dokdonella sp.]HNV09569.1 DUF3016 domain-containing protein [Dokdonella sp.]HPW04476.1 DUF3016 domain-containing protein [Dokdonella sp.]